MDDTARKRPATTLPPSVLVVSSVMLNISVVALPVSHVTSIASWRENGGQTVVGCGSGSGVLFVGAVESELQPMSSAKNRIIYRIGKPPGSSHDSELANVA